MAVVPGATGLRRQTIRTFRILARAGIPEVRIAGAIRRAGAVAGTVAEAAIGRRIRIVRYQGTLQAVAIRVAAVVTADPTPTARGRGRARPEAMAGRPAGAGARWIRQSR